MRAEKFVYCLLMIVLFAGIPTGKAVAQSGEDFKPFLDKFTSSAAFQYTRIKFPLKTPITLLADERRHSLLLRKNGLYWIARR